MTAITYDNSHVIIVDYTSWDFNICDTCNVVHKCKSHGDNKYAWLFRKCIHNVLKVPNYENKSMRIYKIFTMLTYKLFL